MDCPGLGAKVSAQQASMAHYFISKTKEGPHEQVKHEKHAHFFSGLKDGSTKTCQPDKLLQVRYTLMGFTIWRTESDSSAQTSDTIWLFSKTMHLLTGYSPLPKFWLFVSWQYYHKPSLSSTSLPATFVWMKTDWNGKIRDDYSDPGCFENVPKYSCGRTLRASLWTMEKMLAGVYWCSRVIVRKSFSSLYRNVKFCILRTVVKLCKQTMCIFYISLEMGHYFITLYTRHKK